MNDALLFYHKDFVYLTNGTFCCTSDMISSNASGIDIGSCPCLETVKFSLTVAVKLNFLIAKV